MYRGVLPELKQAVTGAVDGFRHPIPSNHILQLLALHNTTPHQQPNHLQLLSIYHHIQAQALIVHLLMLPHSHLILIE